MNEELNSSINLVNMFEVKSQISAAIKMLDIPISYMQISYIDDLYLRVRGSKAYKLGIYSPEEGVAFLLQSYTEIQKQEINND